jgi:hypothetical protein
MSCCVIYCVTYGCPPPLQDIVDGDAVTRSFCGTEQYMSPEMLLQQVAIAIAIAIAIVYMQASS